MACASLAHGQLLLMLGFSMQLAFTMLLFSSCRACLSPLAKKVYSICDMEHVAAIMVVLRSCGSNIVVKGMPAFRVEESELQVSLPLQYCPVPEWWPSKGPTCGV